MDPNTGEEHDALLKEPDVHIKSVCLSIAKKKILYSHQMYLVNHCHQYYVYLRNLINKIITY